MDELRPKDIRFDIIVPIHNMESIYVLKAIDSILNQSHRKWRVTIVESQASFVKTEGKWRIYVTELDDSRFYHCVEHKKGIAAARNQASKIERSDFIAFLDGDDSWMTHHLQTMAEAICLSTPDTVMWWSRLGKLMVMESMMTGIHEVKVLEYSPYEGLEIFTPPYYYYYFMVHPAYPSSVVVRRTAFEEIGGFDEEMIRNEDQELVMRLLHPSNPNIAQFVDELTVYREPSVENHKISAEGVDYTQMLVDKYPWPESWDKPDEVIESDWQAMMDHIYETRQKNFTLK